MTAFYALTFQITNFCCFKNNQLIRENLHFNKNTADITEIFHNTRHQKR